MSDVPPSRPFLLRACGFEAEFLAGIRRHQYAIHDGLIGHHTQLPRRRPREAATDQEPDDGNGRGAPCCAGACVRRCECGGAHMLMAGETDGNAADQESDAAPPPPPPPSHPSSTDSCSTAQSAVESQLRTLLELTRVLGPPADGGAAAANAVPEYLYWSVGVHVRALYEALGDARRAEPLVSRRKRAKRGLFNTVRLRVLQRFVLQVGGAGLSEADQEFLYDFLDVWDGTKAGRAEDTGHHKTLRYQFPSVKVFKNALRDDLDNAALDAGWKKVRLVEGGVAYEAYFRDVLRVIRGLIKKKGDHIQMWSGVAGPAPPSDKR